MDNKILIILGIVFVVGIISMIGAYAYKGDLDFIGPNYDEDVHAKLEAAIEAGDYDAWIKIRQDNNLPMNGRMFQVINKDNFSKYAKMHDAMLSGDTTKANEIRSELGLGQGMRNSQKGSGQGCGKMNNALESQGKGGCQNHALSKRLN